LLKASHDGVASDGLPIDWASRVDIQARAIAEETSIPPLPEHNELA
jgi:hypothetical protein